MDSVSPGTHRGMTKLAPTAVEHQERGVRFARAHVSQVNDRSLVESSQNRWQGRSAA